MKSDTLLDYAVFQLSPKRSRCELFVSGDGKTEKLASGLLKPFVTHLTAAEEQVARAVQSIKLEVEKRRNAGTWFTKGTLERFVRFVSTPEVLELVNTFDAEMSQLEAARRIYSQGVGDQLSGPLGRDETVSTEAADVTKKELLKAIDVRLVAVKQDLTTACARASAAGFSPDTVTELQLFADRFGAHRLNEACSKFISLCQRRPDLINQWKAGGNDLAVRSSFDSDMSIDDLAEENVPVRPNGPHQPQRQNQQQQQASQERDAMQRLDQSETSTCQQPKSSLPFPTRYSSESSSECDKGIEGNVEKEKDKEESVTESFQTSQPSRRLSVQDRINLFENKQKEQSGSGGKVAVGKPVELRRLSSDVSSSPQVVVEKAVLRRWSGASDMSVDLSNERKETGSTATTPSSTSNSQAQFNKFPTVNESKDPASSSKPQTQSSKLSGVNEDKDGGGSLETATSSKPGRLDDSELKYPAGTRTQVGGLLGREENVGSDNQTDSEAHLSSSDRSGSVSSRDRLASQTQSNALSSRAESILLKGQTASEAQPKSFSSRDEDVDVKDSAASQARFRSYLGGAEHVGLQDQASVQKLFRTPLVAAERSGVKDQVASQTQVRVHLGRVEDVPLKDQAVSRTQSGSSVRRTNDVELRDQPAGQALSVASSNTKVDIGLNSKHPSVSHIQAKPLVGKLDSGTETKDQVASLAQYSTDRHFKDLSAKVEDSSLQGMKLQRQSSAPVQSKKLSGRRTASIPVNGNSESFVPERKTMESPQTFGSATIPSIEKVQKIRQSKGNQELNDELQMKADELEKLFAAHKLRVPGDQSAVVRRTKAANVQIEPVENIIYRKPADVNPIPMPEKNLVREPYGSSSNVADSDVSSLKKMVDNRDYSNTLKQNITEFGLSENSRGKFYDRYMQKRDAKLREEWGSKRSQKEAKMKAMQDSLERSRAEMKAKFPGTADRQDSALYARRRAEKLRSFNVRLATKNIEQQPIGSVQSEEDEDSCEFPEYTQYEQDRSFSETSLGDGSSRSTQSKKFLSNRNLSSSIPRTSAAPIPRSSAKGINSSSGRRRTQPDNPLAQSVPNFSDFRKENTKPSLGASKTTTHSQFRNYSRSKSTIEELPLVKEDKPRRSQSMRKSCVSPGESKDLSPLNSDGVVLTPLRFAKEQSDQSLYSKIPKNSESKPFLRKGNGIGPGAGAGIAKLKASMASENLKDEEESDELADSVDMVKEDEEEEEEEFVTVTGEEAFNSVDIPADLDNEKPRLSQESEKSSDSGSENVEVLRSLSQVDPNSEADMAAVGPTASHALLGLVQNSPGESPASWNSRMHNPFSYANETSDIDASVDSPMGSPASWNSHSLSQMESDAARMRKKWGSAQKPILVANTSQHQSRKDMTKGFKRLLKFGRKSRGSESLVDWISATTSEGDDDTEEGRDLANRSSDDLRKSRMGFSQGHPSYDSFNDGELFNEQVQALHSSIPEPPDNFKLREDHLSGSSLKAPRSFFSLSSFRSKGSESKPR